MKTKFPKIFFLLAALFSLPVFVSAAPNVDLVSGSVVDGQSVSIDGSSFGTKSTAAPKYFNKFENEIIGQMPSDQMTNLSSWGTVEANNSHEGYNSLEFDYCADLKVLTWQTNAHYFPGNVVTHIGSYYLVKNEIVLSSSAPNLDVVNYEPTTARAILWVAGSQLYPDYVIQYNNLYYRVKNAITSSNSFLPNVDTANYELTAYSANHCTNTKVQEDWKRNGIDLGSGADRIYFSAWVFLDKGFSTAYNWQWKSFNVSSSNQLYYDLAAQYQTNTTSQQANYWWNNGTNHWYNSLAYLYYWNGSAVTHGEVSPVGAPSDALLWGQWQRLEFYAQRSSASGVADGIWREQRIGRAGYIFNITNATNWITGNNEWRYIALSHAIASVYSGYLDLKIYMDDIYADSSQARVEICDNAVWSSRTHCEIQLASSWNDSQIQFDVNRGTFPDGQAYLFVINESGIASSGYPISFGVQTDFVAPFAPQGLEIL